MWRVLGWIGAIAMLAVIVVAIAWAGDAMRVCHA